MRRPLTPGSIVTKLARSYIRYSPLHRGKGRVAAMFIAPFLPRNGGSFLASLPEDKARVRVRYDEDLGFILYAYGTFEGSERRALRRLARPGATAIDVGANIGIETIALSRAVGSGGRVIAFEPAPANIARLEENLARNRIENVRIVPGALGATVGQAPLYLSDDGAYASLTRVSEGQSHSGTITVPVTTLDMYARSNPLGDVSVIKIDVEGGELDVLRGAEEVIAASKPALLVESRTRAEGAPVHAWLVAHGYREQRVRGFYAWNHLYRVADAAPASPAGTRRGR